VGIEATNDVAELDRALEEMKTGRQHTHASYIACTPALAAEFLWVQAAASAASHWDAELLRRRLQASGCRLLLVEGDAVAQAVLPKERRPDKAMLTELATAIQGAGATPRGQLSK
jgi:riboflavin biosynthesis pyrimidine reductase